VSKTCMERFFDLLREIRYEHLPKEVVEKAKTCVADYVSVFIGGRGTDESEIILKSLGGDIKKLSVEDIAFWMGATSRILDMDDGHRFAMGHPGAPILSSAFAALTEPGVVTDGKSFLLGIVKGYEMYCYLGRSINPSAYLGRGFDSTSICGAAAAAVSAGTVMGLPSDIIFHATTIACSLCGGLTHCFEDGSSPKYLCVGWAGKLAIMAIKVAQAGLRGPREILEGKNGYCHAFSPKPHLDYLNNPKLVYEVMNIYFKRFACIRRIHATLDALETILIRNKLDKNGIKKINVYAGKFVMGTKKYYPKHLVEAQSSLPYSVAVYLKYNKVTRDLLSTNLNDLDIINIMNSVSVEEDDKFNMLMINEPSLWGGARVEVIMKGGKVYSEESKLALGGPEMPFDQRIMYKKFFDISSSFLASEKIIELWQKISVLENIENMDKEVLSLMEAT